MSVQRPRGPLGGAVGGGSAMIWGPVDAKSKHKIIDAFQ
jgi:hypothetical protein